MLVPDLEPEEVLEGPVELDVGERAGEEDVLSTEDSDEAAERPGFVRRHPRGVLAFLSTVVAIGLSVAFFVVFAFGLSAVQERRNQTQLYRSLRGLLDPSSTVSPWVGGKIPLGSPLYVIEAPKGGLTRTVVVEGSSSAQMIDGPGHLSGTPLPGQVGDSIVIGRSSTTGAPFGSVSHLKRGDKLVVTTGQGTFHFVVQDTRTATSKLPKVPKSGSLLTLVTSAGTGTAGSLLNAHMLYVDAALKGRAVAAPKTSKPHVTVTKSKAAASFFGRQSSKITGDTAEFTAAEIQGHADTSALPWVLVGFAALVASLLGSVWLVRRWGWARAWLVVAPVVLAVGWVLGNQLLSLVPNVY